MKDTARHYLDPALALRLKNLELRARQVVEGFITGLHRSPYHGFSVEFAEHRPYNPGDEPRRLDWKVLGKTDRLYVKQFEEETNLRQYIVVDTSASMHYKGSAELSKLEYAATLSASLAYLMTRQRDATGLVLFDEKLHTVLLPKSTPGHLRATLVALEHALRRTPAKNVLTSASAALDHLADRLTRRALVVLMTDLLEPSADPQPLLKSLRRLRSRGHEVIVFHVMDTQTERLLSLPEGPIRLRDAESGAVLTLNAAQVRAAYQQRLDAFREPFVRGCREHRIDVVEVDTATPYGDALLAYLNKRKRAR